MSVEGRDAPHSGATHRMSRRVLVLPSFSVVLAFSLVLAVLVSLNLPLPGRFPEYAGSFPVGTAAHSRCLTLRYELAAEGKWNPSAVALHSTLSTTGSDGRGRYRGVGYHHGQFIRPVSWHPAGPDSIDIQWHHSPVLRLPARGQIVVGRGGWSGFGNWVDALTAEEFRIIGEEIRCSSLAPASELGDESDAGL